MLCEMMGLSNLLKDFRNRGFLDSMKHTNGVMDMIGCISFDFLLATVIVVV